MRLYGLMITKDDAEIFSDWCRDQLGLYDAVVCLDGSTTDQTARIARAHADRLVYLHERDYAIAHKTDHGLRGLVHEQIVRRFGTGYWIMCCHADEFCYHDPRRIAAKAGRASYNLVTWFSPHFYPHPRERADWPLLRDRPVWERVRHYHWSYRGDGSPWHEDRLYFCDRDVRWDGVTQGNVRPLGVDRQAPFHPILCHYKVYRVDPADFEVAGSSSHYRQHWVGQEHRTGVPFTVRCNEDLFVDSIPDYTRCDRFDDNFPYEWNMGEEYRIRLGLSGPESGIIGPSRDWQIVVDALSVGLNHRPDVPEAWLHLGHALQSLGRTEEAIGAWGRVLALRPGHSGATIALRQAQSQTGSSVLTPPNAARASTTIAASSKSLPLNDRIATVPFVCRGAVDRAICREIWERDVYGVRCFPLDPDTVIDIGAHIGAFAVMAAEAWPGAQILACEADPDNVDLLRRNLAGYSNVAIVPAAITGDDIGEVDFRMVGDKTLGNSGGGSCCRPEPGTRLTRVPAQSILRLWRLFQLRACALLKLDCEGMEATILKALADAGLLAAVEHVVGEWHAQDGSVSSIDSAHRAIQVALEPTHDFEVQTPWHGREGYFSARRKLGRRTS